MNIFSPAIHLDFHCFNIQILKIKQLIVIILMYFLLKCFQVFKYNQIIIHLHPLILIHHHLHLSLQHDIIQIN